MDFDSLLSWLGAAGNWLLHTISVSALVASLAGLVPLLFAVPAFVYYCMLIWRDPAVKAYFARRRTRRIAQLKRRIKELEDELTSP